MKAKTPAKLNKNVTNYSKLQDRLIKKVNPVFANGNGKKILDQLKSGENKYLKLDRIETVAYDPRWINEIEDCIPDLDFIIKNPKKVIENVSEVVPIELARKTNADSVKHLSTHSQYVKEIDDKGDVVPNKILNIRSDDFYQTYENRFIATLVRRLILFVEKRYTILLNATEGKETELLYYKNNSTVDGQTVEIETKIKVVSDVEISEEEISLNKTYISRIEEIRKYLLFFYNSEFMKMLKNERNVRNPIIMTNILRKNHKYNHCYNLYKFIEHYDLVGVELKVSDKYSKLEQAQIDEINDALMVSFLSLRCKEVEIKHKEKIKKAKPKIITSIDDEAFVYGDYINSPFEFVRVDDNHVKYLKASIPELPSRPSKPEREYFSKEYEDAKKKEQEINRINALKKEKAKRAAIDNKKFEKIVKERELENAKAKAAREEAERQAKLNSLEAARRALMGKGGHFDIVEDDEVKQEDIKPATIKENKKPTNKKNKPAIKETTDIKEEPVTEEPNVEEKPQIVKKTKKNSAPKKKEEILAAPEVKAEVIPEVKEEVKPAENKPAEEEPIQREVIPGKFIVKTAYGYFVMKDVYSKIKEEAKIFFDFNEANDIKKEKGGKVVKL